ncbi:hypothetical protein M011DRAFT_474279 [Sporormia fimetaria CBS 119925]|uniref:Uncharacterized protein n=1 Tax=Sporormia fimetaria CBS 119925 TaxID=1340428 RepID=A0A6A6VLV0_9PLEO|nr:hypothetical protein M011DRAFT_474279 [Sporormia fimetaria CBS 119925]
MGSGQSKPEAPALLPPPTRGVDAKTHIPEGSAKATKPKPCCVCLDEKAARDKCMLNSTSDDPQAECGELITAYKKCMDGYGFKI